MKYFLPFTLLLFICTPALSQRKISGEVTDLKSGDPITGATIKIGSLQTVSDRSGKFSIEIDADTLLECTAVGFVTFKWRTTASRNYYPFNLQPAANNLDDVVVSGTLRAIQRSASPIPVESYGQRFLKKNPTPSIFEALAIVNGVQPQLNCNVCNTGDIHINGMEGPYTMILIDGMPIVSSLGSVYGLSGIPNSIVKRIEVIKGPASTLYGSEAMGGLVNIITKDVLSANRFNADVSLTTWGELNADISAKFVTGKASSLLGINVFNYWNKQDNNHDNFTDVTQQRRISLFNKWDFGRKNNLPASLAVRLFAENRWGGEMQWNKQFRGGDSLYGESIYTYRGELIGNYGIALNKEKLLFEYSYNFHRQDSYYGTTKFFADQHTGFAQLRWNKTIAKHNLLAGIPVRYIWYDDNTPATAKPGGTKPAITATTGLFVQDETNWSKQWTTLIGLRYEYHNIQGSVVAPRVAVKWQPNANNTFRLSGGNGFRVVNLFTEDHAAISGFREVVIKNNLKPERSWNATLNYNGQQPVKWGFIGLDASLFYTRFSNKIIPDYDTDPNLIIYDNLSGYAVSQGISANLDVIVRNGPKILAGITWMDVFTKQADASGVTTKEAQVFAPRFSGNYTISYTLNKWKTSFDLTGKLFGPQRLPVVPNDYRAAYSPWFTLMNIQATQKIGAQLEVYLSVKNLLNFMPRNPLLHPDDPFNKPGGKYFDANGVARTDTNPYGYTFDPSYNYAPLQGIRALLGVRWNVL